MARLSIIIPAICDTLALEDTLVSVLSHRPADSEILLPHAATYDDPYGVGEEVTLLDLPARTTSSELIAAAIKQSQGDVVHLLLPGCEVDSDWCVEPLAYFAKPEVASVTPILLGDSLSSHGTCGVAQSLLGRKNVRSSTIAGDAAEQSVLGPTIRAGFYRRRALEQIGGWPTGVGLALSDLDVALSLREIGYDFRVASTCRIIARGELPTEGALTLAMAQEQLFRRHSQSGARKALRPATSLWQCLSAGMPWQMAAAAAGKLMACFHGTSARQHQELLKAAESAASMDSIAEHNEDHDAPLRRAA